MTSQQFADVLLAQWQLLWPLSPAERIKRIDEVRQDYEFENVLQRVEMEMSENGEPLTPREEAELRAELTIRDAWLAVTAACNMHKDPISRPFVERQFDDLMSMRTKLDFLCAAIDVSREKRSAA